MQNHCGDPDRPLIDAVAVGDAAALDTLYQRHGLHLLNYLIGQLEDRALAEEVLQAVMLVVWENAASFRGDSLVRTWLFGIARRQGLKAMRKRQTRQKRHVDTPLDAVPAVAGGSVSAVVEQRLREAALAEAIADLPEDQQEALEMVFFRGLTINEAAVQLRINPNTLKSRLHRAKANLRRLLTLKDDPDA